MARTRTTYQRGSLVPYRGKLQLRYREWDAARGRWLNRRKIMINPNTKSPFTAEGSPPRIPKQAQALADALMAKINQRNNAPTVSNASLTLSQFLASTWEDYLDEHNVQASTRSTYRSMLDARILPAFGERELSSITPVDLSRFIAKIKTSPATGLISTASCAPFSEWPLSTI